MTTEQMIAWLIIEGWNPVGTKQLYHRATNRITQSSFIQKLTSIGQYHAGRYDSTWDYLRGNHERLTHQFKIISGEGDDN